MQATWLSYGSVDRHRCIAPDLEKNRWVVASEDEAEVEEGEEERERAGGGEESCGDLLAQDKAEAIWEVRTWVHR